MRPLILIGAGIGAAMNMYNSWDLLEKGEYGKFLSSVGVGALTGALSASGAGFFSGMFLGGTVSGIGNEFVDHIIRRKPCERLLYR